VQFPAVHAARAARTTVSRLVSARVVVMSGSVSRYLAGSAVLGLALALTTASALARPMKFDLICHYVPVSGHEVWTGFPHYPYRGPRVRTEHEAIDLLGMTERSLNHGFVPGPERIPWVNKTEIRFMDTPYIKMIVHFSDGRFTRIDVEDDNTLWIFKGRCRQAPFTPPGPPGQEYRGW